MLVSAIKQATCHLSSSIIGRVSLFGYVIYSSACTQCQQCEPARVNNIAKQASNASARDMELGSLDGKQDGELNGVRFVEISKISLSFGKISFDKLYIFSNVVKYMFVKDHLYYNTYLHENDLQIKTVSERFNYIYDFTE